MTVASGNNRDLVDLAERLRQSADDVRHSGKEFVHDGGLVVFLEGLGLDVHGFGFRFALLEDNFRFGFALCANRGGATFGFADQALPFGVSDGLDALALDFGLLEHGGDELAFAALNFRVLHLDLRFALYLLHFHSFGNDLLLHDVGFDFVGFVRGSLGLLGHLQVTGFLEVQIALGFGLFGQRGGFRKDAFLIGLRFGYGGGALRFGALDGDVAFGFGSGDFRYQLDASDVRPAHVGDVFVLVADFLNGEAHHVKPHLVHVRGARGTHAFTDHFRLFHQLLDGKLANDSAQVALHHQANQSLALIGPL